MCQGDSAQCARGRAFRRPIGATRSVCRVLERFVATAREKAHEETFRQLTPLLTNERKTVLDGLLQADATTGRTLTKRSFPQTPRRRGASTIRPAHTACVRVADRSADAWQPGDKKKAPMRSARGNEWDILCVGWTVPCSYQDTLHIKYLL